MSHAIYVFCSDGYAFYVLYYFNLFLLFFFLLRCSITNLMHVYAIHQKPDQKRKLFPLLSANVNYVASSDK